MIKCPLQKFPILGFLSFSIRIKVYVKMWAIFCYTPKPSISKQNIKGFTQLCLLLSFALYLCKYAALVVTSQSWHSRFPKDPPTGNQWKKLIRLVNLILLFVNRMLYLKKICRRTIDPDAFVCGCHFVDGKKKNGPTILQHSVIKRLKYRRP